MADLWRTGGPQVAFWEVARTTPVGGLRRKSEGVQGLYEWTTNRSEASAMHPDQPCRYVHIAALRGHLKHVSPTVVLLFHRCWSAILLIAIVIGG